MSELFDDQLASTSVAAVFSLAVRGSLAVLFLASGWSKLKRPADFGSILHRYGLVPKALIPAVVWGIVAFELGLAVALGVFVWLPHPLALAAAALAIFSLAIAINLVRGRSFDCGCSFVREHAPISWLHVGRNFALCAACASAAVVTPSADLAGALLPAVIITTAAILITGLGIAEQWLRQLTPYQVGPILRRSREARNDLAYNGQRTR